MLILKRKAGEAIVIGGPAVVRVFSLTGGQFKIGIDAPAATEILRGELATADQIRAAMAEKVPLHAIEDELDCRDEMKRLPRCNLHPGCRLYYDGDRCPYCKMKSERSEMVGANQWLRGELDRLKYAHGVEIRTLESRILDLEDRLPDEEPCEEPRRPEDMGSRHGLEVSKRDFGKEPRS